MSGFFNNSQHQGNIQSQNSNADSSEMDANIDNPASQPADTIACLAWAPNPNMRLLAAGGWDGKVMIYELTLISMQQKYLSLKTSFENPGSCPVLSLSWKNDCSMIFFCSSDGSVKAYSPASSQITVIGNHQAPARHVFWVEELSALCSISFDLTIKFWQLGNPNPVVTLNTDLKVYVADLVYPILALAFQNDKLSIIDLNNLNQIPGMRITNLMDNPLGSQIISISVSHNRDTIAFGGCDGRGNLSKLAKEGYMFRMNSIMTFKAHKTGEATSQIMFPINAIGFNPKSPQYVFTAGGDSKIYFWDFLDKQKISDFTFGGIPITAASTSPDGNFLAYALGYDWQKGVWGLNVGYKNKICVKIISDTDLKYVKK